MIVFHAISAKDMPQWEKHAQPMPGAILLSTKPCCETVAKRRGATHGRHETKDAREENAKTTERRPYDRHVCLAGLSKGLHPHGL
jgi:hypothetical protein